MIRVNISRAGAVPLDQYPAFRRTPTHPSDGQNRSATAQRLMVYVADQFDVAGRALGLNRRNIYAGVDRAASAIGSIQVALHLGHPALWPQAAILCAELRQHATVLEPSRRIDRAIAALSPLIKASMDRHQRAALKRVYKRFLTVRQHRRERLLSDNGGLFPLRLKLGALRQGCAELPWDRLEPEDIHASLRRLKAFDARSVAPLRYRDLVQWERRQAAYTIACLECDATKAGMEGPESGEPLWLLMTLTRRMEPLHKERGLRAVRRELRALRDLPEEDRAATLDAVGAQICVTQKQTGPESGPVGTL